jgi:PTH1 family peptidyl-tRNA hydrolase
VKLIVGLGNPGSRYRGTRHNVGFRVVDCFASRLGIPLEQSGFESRFGRGRVQGLDVGLLEPQTFMNGSGRAVAAALGGLPVDEASTDLLVIYDDADLPLGRLRLRARGGDGGHLGLRDVIASIGTRELPRLRFGIGRPADLQDTVAHVLQEFSHGESDALAPALDRASAAVETFVVEGIVPAMDRFNAPPEVEGEGLEPGGKARTGTPRDLIDP